MLSCGSASASLSPRASPSRNNVVALAPPSPKAEASAAIAAKSAKVPPPVATVTTVAVATAAKKSTLVMICFDKFAGFWVMVFTYLVAALPAFWGFLLTKAGIAQRVVAAVESFSSCNTEEENCIELKQLASTAVMAVRACTITATFYVNVKDKVPSLVWSEPVATVYIKPVFDFSALVADRLLVIVDTKADQCIYILGNPVESVKMVITGCVATPVGVTRWVIAGSYNFIFNEGWLVWLNPVGYVTHFTESLAGAPKSLYNLAFHGAWVAWVNPAAYLPYFTATIAGMPSSKAGTRGRVALTRLNFVASNASNLSLTATGAYKYGRSWIPNFLAATLKGLEDGVMLYATPFIVFADDACDKLLTAADIQINTTTGNLYDTAANLMYAIKNPTAIISTFVAMCWSTVYAVARWVTIKVVPASYLVACVDLYNAVNLASFFTLILNIWNKMPASSTGRWAIATTLGMYTALHDIIVPMALYKYVLDWCIYIATTILASSPFKLAESIVHPRVAFFLDPLYNMAITSEPLTQAVTYWAPVAAGVVG